MAKRYQPVVIDKRLRRYRYVKPEISRANRQARSSAIAAALLFVSLPILLIPTLKTVNPFLIVAGAAVLSLMLAVVIRDRRWKRIEQVADEYEAEQARISVQRTASNLHRVSPDRFEQEVCKLLSFQFHLSGTVVGQAGDGGVDIELHGPDGKLKGIVQCKHKRDPNAVLAPNVIREMDGIKRRLGIPLAIVATTARFSPKSYQDASHWGITLYDGIALSELSLHRDELSAPEIPIQTPVSAPVPPASSTGMGEVSQQIEERRKRLGLSNK